MKSPDTPLTYDRALEITLERLETTIWMFPFESDPELVVELSKTDPKYFEVLRLRVGSLIIEEGELPKPYREWLYAFLYDGVTPPKVNPGRRSDPLKFEKVVTLVKGLVDLGMKPTRNDASLHNDSACDAVAAALMTVGEQPQSYARVKRIWLENRDIDIS